jgi:hypothetical protein
MTVGGREPEQAERVGTIFTRYLKLGSLAALAENLNSTGIRTRRRRSDGEGAGTEVPFSTGALAHLLKNRFYVGEVVYRGEVYQGDHQAVIDLPQFEAVQAKLAANAVERQVRLREASAILTGRIFDDRGNPMTPIHSNKRGVRYRYYISHPLLQKRKQDAGSVLRVPAPEIERKVTNALRARVTDSATDLAEITDRDLWTIILNA